MRIEETIERLARIGAAPCGGVTRVAWSPELFEAYDAVGDELRALGLEVEIDAAGNLLARWLTGSGPAVLVGSHLDTVPNGGALDGALGVVSALHAVRLLKEEGFEPDRPIWVVAFMDEEGTRFDASMFGSLAFVGEDVSALGTRVDAEGRTLCEAMQEAGRDLATVDAAARVGDIGAYIELHIEQGPVLEAAGAQIGVVTSIVGLRGYRLRLRGEANHAGTTPMRLRRDALAGASRVALALRDAARAHEGWTANVGKLVISPGGSNVVPGVAELTIDVRAPTADGVAEWERVVPAIVDRIAAEEMLEAQLEQSFALEPVELDPLLIATVAAAANACGAAFVHLPSGAGHDAMVLGRHVPAAMIFVPSRGGISHSPEEHTDAAELELGVEVLAETLRLLTRPG